MKYLANIHPGEILSEEFLIPMKITAYKLSKDIGIPQTRTSAIIKGVRAITADTALRLSLYFGTSPKFWLGLQDDYDLEEAFKNKKIVSLLSRPTSHITSHLPVPKATGPCFGKGQPNAWLL